MKLAVPMIYQEPMECGIACAEMVLKFYKIGRTRKSILAEMQKDTAFDTMNITELTAKALAVERSLITAGTLKYQTETNQRLEYADKGKGKGRGGRGKGKDKKGKDDTDGEGKDDETVGKGKGKGNDSGNDETIGDKEMADSDDHSFTTTLTWHGSPVDMTGLGEFQV